MSEITSEDDGIQDSPDLVLVDDAPTSLNTAPISGTILDNSIYCRIYCFE